MDKERFEKFIAQIVRDGDWEYADGTPLTEDAKAFLRWYRLLDQLWVAMKRLYREPTVIKIDKNTLDVPMSSSLTILAGLTTVIPCRKTPFTEPDHWYLLVDAAYAGTNALVLEDLYIAACTIINAADRQLLLTTPEGEEFTTGCGCICRRLTSTEITERVSNKQFNGRYLR